MKERAMPDFAIVSVEDAKVKTIPVRQRTYMNEYAGYIQQLSQGKAGKLHLLEDENQLTIRRRLVVAAQTLGIPLTIKRSENDIYFWIEGEAVAQPRSRRSRRSRSQGETAMPDQPLIEPEFPGSDNSPEMVARIEPES
jgi:hypothetical protein